MKVNVTRLLISWIVVYLVYQVIGFAIHVVWLGNTYAALAHVWRPEAELAEKQWIMFLTSAVWSFFFCYIFARGFENRGLAEGARYGAIIGLFFAIPQAYDTYAVFPIPYSLAFTWFLTGLIASILLGIVVALIYRSSP